MRFWSLWNQIMEKKRVIRAHLLHHHRHYSLTLYIYTHSLSVSHYHLPIPIPIPIPYLSLARVLAFLVMDHKVALEEQVTQIMKAMNHEGLTDDHFAEARSLKDINGPAYFSELILRFCDEVQSTLKDMTTAMEQINVSFNDVREYCMKIKGGISCIGACCLAQACKNLILATESGSKERCLEALSVVKQEFYTLHCKLDDILRLEMKIADRNVHK